MNICRMHICRMDICRMDICRMDIHVRRTTSNHPGPGKRALFPNQNMTTHLVTQFSGRIRLFFTRTDNFGKKRLNSDMHSISNNTSGSNLPQLRTPPPAPPCHTPLLHCATSCKNAISTQKSLHLPSDARFVRFLMSRFQSTLPVPGS